ncbi:VWA domain-containing protein [Amycolatopsis sp. NPDC059657]|uniref:VWA domain-containing protein n=1 Tax=Amycolatopsis sp. NPDC059657 TaxID=3346899 RepID=UPI00366D6BA0
MGALTALKDLTKRAGRWLGLGGAAKARAAAPKVTAAVHGDRFDEMTWKDTLGQAHHLRELADDLHERYDYSADLLRDAFLATYKAEPTLRERADMDSSRLVNHQVISALMSSPEFAELRRDTVGDPYAAAMALLAQETQLRQLLEQARAAQEAADDAEQARQDAQDAAEQVEQAMRNAQDAADEDGEVDEGTAAAVLAAIEQAEGADSAAGQADRDAQAALAAAAGVVRALVRAGMKEAVEQVQAEVAAAAAWGVEPGQLDRMSFEERDALARRLQNNRLAEFASLIGRFRQMATGERARKIEHVPGELVGITLGDDLTRLIPSELASLGVPALRAVFAARYAEQRLMTYDSRGETEAGQGAIIACIDCSASMAEPYVAASGEHSGEVVTGEAWAKACALALLDQARQQRRDFVGILFASATEVKVFEFPANRPVSIPAVLEFAEHFFCGGTDFEAPLSAAAEVLQAGYNDASRARGDIVFITDGLAQVGEDWMRAWNETKAELEFRVFGVQIENRAYSFIPAHYATDVLGALCDNLRTLDDLTDVRAAADLFRVI